MKFSVGYTGRDGFEDVLLKHLEHIEHVYLPPPFLPSSAGLQRVADDHVYALKAHRFLDFARERNLPVNLLLDPPCLGAEYASEIAEKDMRACVQMYVGMYSIASVTVSSVAMAQLVNAEFPQLAVHISEVMFVRHPAQARQLARLSHVLTLDPDVNRDLDLIAEIREAYGKPLQIIPNRACVYACVSKVQHYNTISHTPRSAARDTRPCVDRFANDPGLLLKGTIILPGDIHRYEGLVDSMKLASFFCGNEQLDRRLSAYTTATYSGNLWHLAAGGAGAYYRTIRSRGLDLDLASDKLPADFFEKTSTCSRLCSECAYCNDIAKHATQEDDVTRAVRMALR